MRCFLSCIYKYINTILHRYHNDALFRIDTPLKQDVHQKPRSIFRRSNMIRTSTGLNQTRFNIKTGSLMKTQTRDDQTDLQETGTKSTTCWILSSWETLHLRSVSVHSVLQQTDIKTRTIIQDLTRIFQDWQKAHNRARIKCLKRSVL